MIDLRKLTKKNSFRTFRLNFLLNEGISQKNHKNFETDNENRIIYSFFFKSNLI
jgi:hypothetical protein